MLLALGGARLICSCDHLHVCCAIFHAKESASSPSQSLPHQASCQAKRNPMSPSSTTFLTMKATGLHTASRGMPNPVEQLHHVCIPTVQRRAMAVLSRPAVSPFGLVPTSADGESNQTRSEEHTSELQSRRDIVCRLLLEKKKPYQ